MPDAVAIAPATLVGIAEIALPVMTIAGMEIAPMSIFFVIVLSTVQIIFFTESANAMMQTDLDLKFPELVVIFLIQMCIRDSICTALLSCYPTASADLIASCYVWSRGSRY